MRMGQTIRVSEALFEDGTAEEITVQTEAYEGSVAIHVHKVVDTEGFPTLSAYLSPVDAVIYAERIIEAARLAIKDPSSTP